MTDYFANFAIYEEDFSPKICPDVLCRSGDSRFGAPVLSADSSSVARA